VGEDSIPRRYSTNVNIRVLEVVVIAVLNTPIPSVSTLCTASSNTAESSHSNPVAIRDTAAETVSRLYFKTHWRVVRYLSARALLASFSPTPTLIQE
jgi:hypothetical protein